MTDIAAVGQPVFAASYSHSQPENTNFLSAAPTSLTFSKQPDADTSYQIDFSTNHASGANFPFYTWAKLMKEVMSDCSSELLTPSPAAGILELREAIARHLSDFRGMKVLPEQIIVGAGTEYLYGLLIQLFGTDQTFAVEDPGYSKIRMIYESHGVDCLCLPLDNEGIHMAALSACNADILHLSPSHHYPTGIVTPVSRRYELLGGLPKSLPDTSLKTIMTVNSACLANRFRHCKALM